MSENLNYGYKKPEANDESKSQWMPIISDNWDRISDHAHDGDDSALITSSSLSKYQTEIVSGRLVATGLSYSVGDKQIDLLALGATAGMYVEGDQLNFENYIVGVTGTSITLNQGVTGSASATGEIIVSRYKRTKSSTYEIDLTLPTGYPSNTSYFKFYISNSGDTYENYETFPTVVYTDLNTVKVQVNKSSYNMKVVVL